MSALARILANLSLRDRVQVAVHAYEHGIVRPGHRGLNPAHACTMYGLQGLRRTDRDGRAPDSGSGRGCRRLPGGGTAWPARLFRAGRGGCLPPQFLRDDEMGPSASGSTYVIRAGLGELTGP